MSVQFAYFFTLLRKLFRTSKSDTVNECRMRLIFHYIGLTKISGHELLNLCRKFETSERWHIGPVVS